MRRPDRAAESHDDAGCAIACVPPCRACRVLPSSTSCCCRPACWLALAWVNVEPESYYHFTFAIAFAVNDVAIALFFALITKEVVEATAPGGVLHPWRRAMLPVVASLGAVAVPALLHLRLVEVFDDPMLAPAGPPPWRRIWRLATSWRG